MTYKESFCRSGTLCIGEYEQNDGCFNTPHRCSLSRSVERSRTISEQNDGDPPAQRSCRETNYLVVKWSTKIPHSAVCLSVFNFDGP